MVSKSLIDNLSRRIDELAVAFAPESSLPVCPAIFLNFGADGGNTSAERAAIESFFERAAVRGARVRFEVSLAFDEKANAGGERRSEPWIRDGSATRASR